MRRDVRCVARVVAGLLAVLAVPLAAAECFLCGCLWLHTGESAAFPLLFTFGLSFQATGFQLVLTSLACFLWLMTTAFCPYYFHGHDGLDRYQLFSFITWGAIIGAFLPLMITLA